MTAAQRSRRPRTARRRARPRRSSRYLVWMDCEMTGLDPQRHALLEIATVITNSRLETIAEGPVLAIRQGERALGRMDAWCRRTHTRNGLLERVRTRGVPLREAEAQTLRFLRRYCKVRSAPLCGNTIGQDRRFLVRYMPALHAFFHYQSIDVSTVKQLVRRWYGAKREPSKKRELHLALADIRESIRELAHYRRTVFVRARRTRG
jgi:oligoribonuclease